MAEQKIDTLRIEIEATAKGTSAVFTQLESQLATVQKALDGLNIGKINAARNALNGGLSMGKAERDITNSIGKIQQSLAGLESYKNAALNGDSSAMTSFERRVTSIQSQMDVLGEKMKQAGQQNAFDPSKLDGYRETLYNLQDSLNGAKNDIANMPAPNAEPAESALDRLKSAAATVGSAFGKLGSAMRNAFSNLVSAVKKVHNAMSKLHDKISGFANKGFMRVLKYAFGIRSIYVLFRRLRKAITESFQELQNSGAFFQTTRANIESLKASLTTLKYQFGAVFEPIFNAVAPALQTLIDYLVSAMNALSAFTAKLMGKSTYSKAVANMGSLAKNTGSAAKAQKELNKQLQSFDELNNLTTHDNNKGGSGSGDSSETPSAYYVEESVENALGDFGKKLAELIRAGDWKHVGRAISDKLTEVLQSIPWEKIYEKARNFGKGLADFLNGLITPELFGEIGKTLANALNTVFEALYSFAKEFDWVNLGLSIGNAITEWFKNADFALYGETVHEWLAGLLDAGIAMLDTIDFEEIGTKIADFLNNLQVADLASKLGTFARKLLEGLAEAIKGLWKNSDIQTKLGLAIVGALALAKLTGLSAQLGTALSSYLLANPIVVGKAAIVIAVAVASFEIGKWVWGRITYAMGEKELSKAYDDFTWSDFFETILVPNGDDIDWGAIKQGWFDFISDSRFGQIFSGLLKMNPVGWTLDFNAWFAGLFDKQKDKGVSGGGGGTGVTVEVGIKTKLEGALTKLADFTKLSDVWNAFQSKFKDVSSNLKTTMSGIMQKLPDIESTKDKFVELTKSWKDKTATFRSNVGGALRSITDLDTWKSKIKNLYTSWTGKNATFSVSSTAMDIIEKLKKKMKDLLSTWKDKTANFSLKFSAAAQDLKAWVNNNVLSKIRAAFRKVPILRNYADKLYLAKGGYFESDTLAHIGEAGAEAVIPLENNLQAIHKIANVMLDGMASASKYRYSASPSNVALSGGISNSSINDRDLVMELIAETREQNSLLRRIADKEFSVSSRDVFNATRSESNNYYNRTGNSPFVF